MKVGFTGTRRGMTDLQKEAVRGLLQELKATEGHHGDCIGADADFHALARELGLRIVVHPPISRVFRAFCKGDERRVRYPYLLRNQNIVRAVELIIGVPHGFKELRRAGTWFTIRYAQREKLRTLIVWPDGKVEERRDEMKGKDTYFVIAADDDGDFYFTEETETSLLERLNLDEDGDIELEGANVLAAIPDTADMKYWGGGFVLIIKGKIVVPKPIEIVTKFEV